ncbi:MAG: tRNA pseudouridine(55) synthase TruB [Kiritimatiellae bacterium]|nr:tRNA pseudouridine(55) synthase TruB [Kiritimatiellia bacterium]
MANLDSIARLAELDGVLLVDKPANISSHDVVKAVKQHFNLVKAGHGGTLDPNATGLLVLLVGDATRLSADLMGRDRTYSGVMRLGRTTNTFDREGETVAEKPFDAVTRERFAEAVRKDFLGDSFQKPPAFSVIKMPAHPTYDIVRTAEESERAERLVHVYRLAVTDFSPPLVSFEMSCTKGAVPRVLVHDIGQSLGCGASLEELRRTRCGKFSIDGAIGFMDLLKLDAPGFRSRVVPMCEVGR